MLLCKLHLTYSFLVAIRHNSGWTFWPLFLAEVAQLVWTGWFHDRDPAVTHSPQIFNAVEVRAFERPFQKLDGNPVPSTCSPTCFCYHLVFSIFHLATSCITLLGVFLTCFVYFFTDRLHVCRIMFTCTSFFNSFSPSVLHLSILSSPVFVRLSVALFPFFLFYVMLISALHSCYFPVCSHVRFLRW